MVQKTLCPSLNWVTVFKIAPDFRKQAVIVCVTLCRSKSVSYLYTRRSFPSYACPSLAVDILARILPFNCTVFSQMCYCLLLNSLLKVCLKKKKFVCVARGRQCSVGYFLPEGVPSLTEQLPVPQSWKHKQAQMAALREQAAQVCSRFEVTCVYNSPVYWKCSITRIWRRCSR